MSERLTITKHAAKRYQERVKPALDLVRAKAELEILVNSAGEPSPIPPAWKLPSLEDEGRTYLEPSEGICLVIAGQMVTTVAIRAEQAPEFARAKREQKRREKQKRRARNAYGGHTRAKNKDFGGEWE